MAKTGRPSGLIAYDTDINIHRREQGQAPLYRIVRARTALYVIVIALVAGLMVHTLATRRSEGLAVIHDRNPIYVRLADGAIRNAFTIHILNKSLETRQFLLTVEGLTVEGLAGIDLQVVGDTVTGGSPLITVGPDQTRELRALVTTRTPLPPAASIPLKFTITDVNDDTRFSTGDHFRGP
jgi:polyferredoxin